MHRISGWWCLLQVVKRFSNLDELEAARARRRHDQIEADIAYWPILLQKSVAGWLAQ